MVCLFTGECARYRYACLLVNVHAMVCLFTGECARYRYACLLVNVHAIGTPVYW